MADSSSSGLQDTTSGPEIIIIPLHEDWRYLEDCAKLLNSEWKRSMEARLHSLRKCSDRFPLSLVMVSTSERSHKVLGHSRLASIPGRSDDCYVESGMTIIQAFSFPDSG
ncbi:hypothetical protein RvY_13599-2 [Ramazzottius varieornatus]|uniref:Uncharacterized protein n=1 Tax=Ramazzottius varieornatus TaxID=947166 RepID=A0A1D1VVV9_RAMVA|nr:hypothetical protein RvY_13599-2 [Ramazzottius varieornatus]